MKKYAETEGKLSNYYVVFNNCCSNNIIFLIEGRFAKLISNVHFNRAASREYGSLSELDKEELVGEAPSEREMTKCQMKRRTRTIFCHIQKNVHNTVMLYNCYV